MLADSPVQPIRNLLIDAGSDSNSFFNKPADAQGICSICAAQALFTLQINAPSGGRGHRTSLRGGGPLTTLVLPQNQAATLWQKLWLNVLPQSALHLEGQIPHAQDALARILPWLAPTRNSDIPGNDTPPEMAHPLQAYWSMPRRIRLDVEQTRPGHCSLCNHSSEQLITQYRTRHGGLNYIGTWQHPLTPYSYDAKNEKPPLPLKGSRAEGSYRHWLGLAIGNDQRQPAAAQNVTLFNADKKRYSVAGKQARLWCFGFDMNNMKALCWYDSTLPLHTVDTPYAPGFYQSITHLLDVAHEAASLLTKYVKQARFSRPGDVGSEPAVPQSFWQTSEVSFYRLLQQLSQQDDFEPMTLAPLYEKWLNFIQNSTLNLFDDWVSVENLNTRKSIDSGGMSPAERAIFSKHNLIINLKRSKPMLKLLEIIKAKNINA